MKKIVIFLIISIALITNAFAQEQPSSNLIVSPDNTVVYRLFPTEISTSVIKLNTRNGQIWQVKYGWSNRSEKPINLTPLVSNEEEVNGRFFLYPTKTKYTFILVDQIDGRLWEVKWSIYTIDECVFPIRLDN